jgi:hypothetical protein
MLIHGLQGFHWQTCACRHVFQGLLRQLQASLDGHKLTLAPDLIAKMVRYVRDYGQGGFQGRLDAVLSELKKFSEVVLRPLDDVA